MRKVVWWKPHKLQGYRGLNDFFRLRVTTEFCRGDTTVLLRAIAKISNNAVQADTIFFFAM